MGRAGWRRRSGLGANRGGVALYRRTFSRALRRDFCFVFVEMRGAGGSTGGIAGATFANIADDVEEVRRTIDEDRNRRWC